MIIQNAVVIQDTGKIYKSWHEHDYVSFDVNGTSYFIDGGNEYIRTNIPPDHSYIKSLHLNNEHDVQLVIDTYVTKNHFGENVFVKSMTVSELEWVLERVKHPLVYKAVKTLLNQNISLIDMMFEPKDD